MKNGRYTAGDIVDLIVIPRNKEKNITQVAIATLKDGCKIWSNGIDFQIHAELHSFDGRKIFFNIKAIPEQYAVVAEVVRKKANGRGGWRLGAGRKKTLRGSKEKRTRSFKLTEYEYVKVKKYIEELRQDSCDV